MSWLFAVILSALAIFLILLVLVQRGRGGGLAGALGGMGGSSAFGAKAGDVFTRITVVAATIWIVICLIAVYWAGFRGDALGSAAPASGPLDSTPITTPAPKASTGATVPAAATAPAATAPAASEPAATSAAPATEAPPPAEPAEQK